MPCNSDYMKANEFEKNLSKVYGLLDELETGKLPDNFGDGYDKRVYNKGLKESTLNKKVKELCSKLQKVDVTKYSLEMQMWWRDHQKADKERIAARIKKTKDTKARNKIMAKLSPYEKFLLGL